MAFTGRHLGRSDECCLEEGPGRSFRLSICVSNGLWYFRTFRSTAWYTSIHVREKWTGQEGWAGGKNRVEEEQGCIIEVEGAMRDHRRVWPKHESVVVTRG